MDQWFDWLRLKPSGVNDPQGLMRRKAPNKQTNLPGCDGFTGHFPTERRAMHCLYPTR